jgi:hypothetical protein
MQRGAHCSAGLSTLHYTSCCGAGAITGGSGGTGITSGDVIRQLRSLQKNKRIAGGWPKTAWACRCSRLLPLLSLPPPPLPLLPFFPSPPSLPFPPPFSQRLCCVLTAAAGMPWPAT